MAGLVETRILREDWEVQRRLAELELEKTKLLEVRSTAVGAAADATQFHPANAAGTLSYQHGTFALRHEHVGKSWLLDRPNGVEAIRNEARKLRLVFANVDIACDPDREPTPRSSKGAGAELLCAGNLFGELPRFARPSQEQGWTTYYLMVAPDGAVELSCCAVRARTFKDFVERLFLSDGSDLDSELKHLVEDQDVAADFDPKVARK